MNFARFELRVDPPLLAAVKKHCKQRGISVSKLIIDYFKFVVTTDMVNHMESLNEPSKDIRKD